MSEKKISSDHAIFEKHSIKTSQADELIEAFDIMNKGMPNVLPESLISPFTIMWDITYNCPFNCIFCFNSSGGPAGRIELPEKELLRIADDIINEQVVSVCICGGEPFTRINELLKIVERLSNGKVIVNCVSNGWYITPEILNELSGKIHTIQFSLDAAEPEIHDYIRGKKGAFDRVVSAIHYVSKSQFNKCELTFVPTKINYRSFGDVVKLAVDSGCVSRVRTQHLIQTGRGYDFNLTLNPLEEKEFEEVFVQADNKYKDKISLIFGNPWTHIKYWHEDRIPPIFLQITAEGLAKISPYIPLIVGDLKNELLASIWKRINDNRKKIKVFLNNYKNMNSYPAGCIPWVNRDYELMEDVL